MHRQNCCTKGRLAILPAESSNYYRVRLYGSTFFPLPLPPQVWNYFKHSDFMLTNVGTPQYRAIWGPLASTHSASPFIPITYYGCRYPTSETLFQTNIRYHQNLIERSHRCWRWQSSWVWTLVCHRRWNVPWRSLVLRPWLVPWLLARCHQQAASQICTGACRLLDQLHEPMSTSRRRHVTNHLPPATMTSLLMT